MSHGDRVLRLPPGFQRARHAARTRRSRPCATATRPIWGLQFHPEVAHTRRRRGSCSRNFAAPICGCRARAGRWRPSSRRRSRGSARRSATGRVVCGLSGGVDSSVAAALVHRAIGDRLTCIFVDNGLLRAGRARAGRARSSASTLGCRPRSPCDAEERFLERARGRHATPSASAGSSATCSSRSSRRRPKQARRRGVPGAGHALPGRDRERLGARARRPPSRPTTTWAACPSACSSSWSSRCASCSRTRCARSAARLGLPESAIRRHPFPGPGLAIRVLGEVTAERLAIAARGRRDRHRGDPPRRASTTRSGRPSRCSSRCRASA